MSVANFGFNAFDFYAPEGDDISEAFKWSLPSDRSAKVRSAVHCIYQNDNIGEESDVVDRFSYHSGTKDVTDWTLVALLAPGKGADPAVQTLAVGSGINLVDAGSGVYDVAYNVKLTGGVSPGKWSLSVYRTDTGHKILLAFVSLRVFYTGA